MRKSNFKAKVKRGFRAELKLNNFWFLYSDLILPAGTASTLVRTKLPCHFISKRHSFIFSGLFQFPSLNLVCFSDTSGPTIEMTEPHVTVRDEVSSVFKLLLKLNIFHSQIKINYAVCHNSEKICVSVKQHNNN